jgi:hypothetical protein
MTDEQLNALVEGLDEVEPGQEGKALILCGFAASAIRQLMRERDEARIAGAWLYGLELERPGDYAEQKPLAMAACHVAFTHPPAPS